MDTKNLNNHLDSDLYFDLKSRLLMLRTHWQFITAAVFLLTLLTAVVTLMIPNTYKSFALVQSSSPQSSVEGQKSILNLNFIGGSKLNEQTQLALILMESRIFFDNLYSDNKFIAEMFALDFSEIDKINFDTSRYDPETNLWIVQKPDYDHARDTFLDKHFAVTPDYATGYVELSIVHRNPLVAKKWVDLIFQRLNLYIKNKKTKDAKGALAFLKNEINTTNVPELRKIFADGINEQTKIIMLSQVTDEFVFSYIDPPFLPTARHSPMRTSTVIIAAVITTILIVAFLLLLQSLGRNIIFNIRPFELKIEKESSDSE